MATTPLFLPGQATIWKYIQISTAGGLKGGSSVHLVSQKVFFSVVKKNLSLDVRVSGCSRFPESSRSEVGGKKAEAEFEASEKWETGSPVTMTT